MRIQPKDIKAYPWYVRRIFDLQKRKYGDVLTSAKIWARAPRVFLGLSAFYGAIDRKGSPIAPSLRNLLIVFVSQLNSCEFCVDLNSATFLKLGESKKKLADLPNFSTSPLFTEPERTALRYAEAITYSDQEVTDEIFSSLKNHYTDDEIVEITAIIAFQNCSTKFNNALKIPFQGFSND